MTRCAGRTSSCATRSSSLQEAQQENEALRRQLNYKSSVPSFQLLSAEVIGLDPE